MGNLGVFSSRLKKCSNCVNKGYSINNYNNEELVQKICAKTSLTIDDIEEWRLNFLVIIKLYYL